MLTTTLVSTKGNCSASGIATGSTWAARAMWSARVRFAPSNWATRRYSWCVTIKAPCRAFTILAAIAAPRWLLGRTWGSAVTSLRLEDGFDGTLFYGPRPPAPLKALDVSGLVIYVGTFSKILFPGLRLGWIVAAPELIDRLEVAKELADEDKMMGIVLDAGAEDLRDDGSAWEVTTPPEAMEKVREALVANGITPATAEVAWIPQNYVKLSGAQAQQMLRMVETLEDHDDVQHVYANFDIDEKEIQAAVAS